MTYIKDRSGQVFPISTRCVFLLLNSLSAQLSWAWFQKVRVLKSLGAVYISSKPVKPTSRGWLIQVIAGSVMGSRILHFLSTEHCVKSVIFTIIILQHLVPRCQFCQILSAVTNIELSKRVNTLSNGFGTVLSYCLFNMVYQLC